MRIICLDDHPTMLESLVRELNMISPHAAVTAFQDAQTALEFAQENGCDVLFCEIDLYGNDGLVFAEKMQEINPRVNVIFTTVCEEAERAKDVFRIHPSGYITKPFTREQLLRELGNLRYPVEDRAPRAAVIGSGAYSGGYASRPVGEFSAAPSYRSEPVRRSEAARPYSSAPAAAAPVCTAERAPIVREQPPVLKEEPAEQSSSQSLNSKDLRRLSRAELLEMLIAQTKETDKLKSRLREAETKLSSKSLAVENAGSIAQAALQINGVFEAAQRAADQYLDNIRIQNAQMAAREQEAAERAEFILAEARVKCSMMENETGRKCDEMVRKAEEETRLRWNELHERMESYLREHEQLRSLMSMFKI